MILFLSNPSLDDNISNIWLLYKNLLPSFLEQIPVRHLEILQVALGSRFLQACPTQSLQSEIDTRLVKTENDQIVQGHNTVEYIICYDGGYVYVHISTCVVKFAFVLACLGLMALNHTLSTCSSRKRCWSRWGRYCSNWFKFGQMGEAVHFYLVWQGSSTYTAVAMTCTSVLGCASWLEHHVFDNKFLLWPHTLFILPDALCFLCPWPPFTAAQ